VVDIGNNERKKYNATSDWWRHDEWVSLRKEQPYLWETKWAPDSWLAMQMTTLKAVSVTDGWTWLGTSEGEAEGAGAVFSCPISHPQISDEQ
jgi:hypothetical protein